MILPNNIGWHATQFTDLLAPSTHGGMYASLGNATWMALGWPVERVELDPVSLMWSYKFQPAGEVESIFVTNPDEWQVVPTTTYIRSNVGIHLRQVAAPVPLLRYSVEESSSAKSRAGQPQL